MANTMFSDPALSSAKLALDGLSLRQQLISQNVANVDTPGYTAQTVSFEDALKQAIEPNTSKLKLANTTSGHIQIGNPVFTFTQSAREGGSYRADMNDVNINTELVDMAEVGIKFQTLSQVSSKRLLLLKAIAMAR